MAHLGRGEYAVLLYLSEKGRKPATASGTKTSIGDDAEFRTAVVDGLVRNGLVDRQEEAGVATLALSTAGRQALEQALAGKWVVDHSGLHEESRSYRFEVPDPVTGRRFVVAVSQQAGAEVAHRVAYSVIAAPSVRASCRSLEAIGPEGAFHVQVAAEGAGDVAIWRKL